MRFAILLFTLFFPLLIQASSSLRTVSNLDPIQLGIGEQKLLNIPGIKRFSISQDRKKPSVRALASTPFQPDEILIQGLRAGVADLWTWKEDGSSEFRSLLVSPRRSPSPSPSPEFSLSNGPGKVIHFQVFLLEVLRSQITRLGVSWPQAFPLTFQSRVLSWAAPLEAWIHMMESEGWGTVLSKPEITVRAPGEAELFSGAEIPLPIRTRERSGIEWKKVGLGLKLKVIQYTAPTIRLEIETESSQLNPEITIGEYPGVNSNRMITQVEAKTETPILLSGLLQERVLNSQGGIPGLSSIPILGKLWGSASNIKDRRELVVLLKPHDPDLPPSQEPYPFPSQPSGKAPPPRNPMSASEEAQIRLDPRFPWNAFELQPSESEKQ